MLEVTNVKVYDLKESVIACRNAMRLEPPEYTDEEFEKSLERAKKLVKASKNSEVKCHDNFLTTVVVNFDVKYPGYWTSEFQRYHFVQITTSASKMHRLCKMEFTFTKYTDQRSIDVLKEKVERYNMLLHNSTKMDGYVTEKELYEAFMEMISSCPMGIELFMRVSTNYKQLQTIYNQRKHHKLIEDWQEGFCKNFIEKLPYAKELIIGE